jgi:hypothetical protein
VLLIATSGENSGFSNWNLINIPLARGQYLYDFPMIGINQNQIVISLNAVPVTTANSLQSRILMIDKAGLYANQPLNISSIQVGEGNPSGYFFATPSSISDRSNEMFLSSDARTTSGHVFNIHRLRRVLNKKGRPTNQATLDINVHEISVALSPTLNSDIYSAPQLGSSLNLECRGSIFETPFYDRNGSFWLAKQLEQTTNNTSIPGIFWMQYDPRHYTVMQSGRLFRGGEGKALLCPSIAINGVGDMLLGVTETSASMYPTSTYYFRKNTDPLGGLRQPRQYQAGNGSITMPPGDLIRVGDYSATVIDPINDRDFWTLEQHGSATNFGFPRAAWAQLKHSAYDFRVRNAFSASGLKINLENIGLEPAQNATVRFQLGLSNGVSQFNVIPATGWSCIASTAIIFNCSKSTVLNGTIQEFEIFMNTLGPNQLSIDANATGLDADETNNRLELQINPLGIPVPIVVGLPAQCSDLTYLNCRSIRWGEIANSSHYQVEFSSNSNFIGIPNRPNILLNSVELNYGFARIRACFHTVCSSWSGTFGINSGEGS